MLLQVRQPARPSGKGGGKGPILDISHYGTGGMPGCLSVSMLFPHTPHAPMMPPWGDEIVESPGDTVWYPPPDPPGSGQSVASVRAQMAHKDGLRVLGRTTRRSVPKGNRPSPQMTICHRILC